MWNYFNLSCGFYNKNLDYSLFNVKDKGITLGFGVEYLENKNNLNLAFRFGERYSNYSGYHDERYFNIYLTIFSSENWYVERD